MCQTARLFYLAYKFKDIMSRICKQMSLMLYDVVGKLNVSSESVQHGVEGLMYLLTESSKLMVRLSITNTDWIKH